MLILVLTKLVLLSANVLATTRLIKMIIDEKNKKKKDEQNLE